MKLRKKLFLRESMSANFWSLLLFPGLFLAISGSLLAEPDFFDFADLITEEIEPNGSDQPQGLPLNGVTVKAVGLSGELGDQDVVDAFSFVVPSDSKFDINFEITGSNDAEVLALAHGPDNQAYFATAGGLWQHVPETDTDPATAQSIATLEQMAQPLGLTADDITISDMAIVPDPNDFRILIILAERGDILSVDLQGNVVWELDGSEITTVTGEATADLTAVAIGFTEETVFPDDENPIVLLETNLGDIELELFPDDAPIHVENFLAYINANFYDGLIFHRVETSGSFSVIQGGGFDPNMTLIDPLFDPIENESLNGLSNLRGTLGMARTNDPDSATSQFYINVEDNVVFDPANQGGIGFTVFGEVTDGLDTVDTISQVAVTGTAPDDPVIIESASVTNDPGSPEIVRTTTVFLADRVSGAILQAPLDFSNVTTYASSDAIGETLLESLLTSDIAAGDSTLPTTVVAESSDPFGANAVVYIPDGQMYPQGFYVSQLGSNFGGDGTVTHIVPDANEPAEAIFTPLFEPNETLILELNPSALAWDSSGDFENKLFMGTFGPSLGDDFDGEVFIVEPNGLMRPFVTEFVDLQGEPVEFDDVAVDGFFDITDMAFSDGGDFGTYLYVLSENIDNNGTDTLGGFQSDLWRIDPTGKAELFVPDIADGAITLAFGGDDYNGDLFVGMFTPDDNNAELLRIDSAGNLVDPNDTGEPFASLEPFGTGFSFSDIVATPDDSIFAGRLLATVQGGSEVFVTEFAPDYVGPERPPVWAGGLQTGDVSSGDLVFDAAGDLFILEQAARRLTRLDVEGIDEYRLGDIQVRTESSSSFEPFVLLENLQQNRIFGLGDGLAENIVNAVEVATLNPAGSSADDQSNPIAFTFDGEGDIFLFVPNSGSFLSGPRDLSQSSFSSLSTLRDISHIETNSGLSDIEWKQLSWATDGSLMTVAENGPDSGLEPNSVEMRFDNQLLSLGNTIDETFVAQKRLDLNDLLLLTVTLDGPETIIYNLTTAEILDETIDPLAAGSYNLIVEPNSVLGIDYAFLVALNAEFETVLDVNGNSGPILLTNLEGEQLQFSLSGSGQAELAYSQQPGTGIVVALQTLTLSDTGSRTLAELLNLDKESNITLDEIIFDGSLAGLTYPGQVNTLRAVEDSKGTIKNMRLGDVVTIDAGDFGITVLETDNLGDPNGAEQSQIDLKSIGRLVVNGDINNVILLDDNRSNTYQEIEVQGGIINSSLFGRSILALFVENMNGLANAIDNATFNFSGTGGQLREAYIAKGDVSNSFFGFLQAIGRLELADGSLTDSTIQVVDRRSRIGTIIAGQDPIEPSEEAGHITNTQIFAFKNIHWVHADGEISGANISTNTSQLKATVNQISSGGNLNATVSSTKINTIHAGVDQSDRRLPEDEDFTGADISGTFSSVLQLKEVSATGVIRNATLRSSINNIENIFAEDGFINSNVSAANSVARIMVGYLKGNRRNVINDQADVSGSVNSRKLGRIYSTGEQDINTDNVRRVGPLVENDPGL